MGEEEREGGGKSESRGAIKGGRRFWAVLFSKMMGPITDSRLAFFLLNRDKIYVDGDCSMNKFQTKDGTPASALSIVQSE